MVFDLQPSRIAPKVMSLLYARGTALPSACWSDGASPGARDTLESLDDKELFEGTKILENSMIGAIRALLYLRTGWIGDVQMHAATAPTLECMYLTGLALRHKGQSDEAKALFLNLSGYPIYEKLKTCVEGRLGKDPRGHAKRFGDIVEFNGGWEPFAFIDLCSQVRDGKLDDNEQTFLRHVQLDEFNLLFAYCYEIVTGLDVLKIVSTEDQSPSVAA